MIIIIMTLKQLRPCYRDPCMAACDETTNPQCSH